MTHLTLSEAEARIRKGLDLADILSGDVPITQAARKELEEAYEALDVLATLPPQDSSGDARELLADQLGWADRASCLKWIANIEDGKLKAERERIPVPAALRAIEAALSRSQDAIRDQAFEEVACPDCGRQIAEGAGRGFIANCGRRIAKLGAVLPGGCDEAKAYYALFASPVSNQDVRAVWDEEEGKMRYFPPSTPLASPGQTGEAGAAANLPNDAALLPCPFCGSREQEVASIRAGGLTWWQVECANEECQAHSGDRGSEAGAIAVWNRRLAALPNDVVKELVEALHMMFASRNRHGSDLWLLAEQSAREILGRPEVSALLKAQQGDVP